MRTSAIILLSTLVFATAADEPAGPLAPAQEQASFRFADDELTADLIAAEPDVISPVAIAWDADGGLFVAEMSDYPTSREKGRIKRLEDRDGDGRYEQVTVFADQLPFPNGVLPWKNGVLATAAPDIWFLTDTNRDGVADHREKILSGFAEGNQQLRVNGLTWGLDNWIYGANGRSDGEIRWADDSTNSTISLRAHDFRFRPDTRQLEAIAGRSQFGVASDDWGNRFLSWNTIPIRHEVLPERYLNRNRYLAATESIFDVLEPGDSGRVYPLTAPPLTFNNESTSHFNALAGLTIYRGNALGEKYGGNAFVGESLRNLVHRRILEPSGPTFTARRSEQNSEFLASTDPWFHPVNFATGPDGALYVVDFYRRFVEHPDFVHGPARNQMPWRTGSEHGRIWRVRLKNKPPSHPIIALSRASAADLVKTLEHPNAWWRDTAQRLLVERNFSAGRVIRALENTVRGSSKPEARVHALYTLDGLGALSAQTLTAATKDADPRVRANAVNLISARSNNAPDLNAALLGLDEDRDSRVRFQLALALGNLDPALRDPPLARLAQRDITNRWHSLAILSSLGTSPSSFLEKLASGNRQWLSDPGAPQTRFLDQLARLIGANHTDRELDACFSRISKATSPAAQFSLLAGLGDSLARAGQPLHRLLEGNASSLSASPDRESATRSNVTFVIGHSSFVIPNPATAAVQSNGPLSLRLAALRVLVHTRCPPPAPVIQRLLEPDQPTEIQSSAASAVADLNDPALAKNLFADWARLTTQTRHRLIQALLRVPATTLALVDALEAGSLSIMELDASSRLALMKNPEHRARMAKLALTSTNRDAEAFQPALKITGDSHRGAVLFARLCLSCHAIQGQGGQVGPDLSGISTRPSEAVLIDIIDPSRQISPDFLSYTLITTDGTTANGLIAAETAASITLRRQAQPDLAILRSQIKELRADTKSLMPDGLEQGLSHQDLADLLAFLRQPDRTQLPK